MGDDVIIRSSSLSGYTDCPRRTAARSFKAVVEAMGYTLRQPPSSGVASVGTGVHSACAHALATRLDGREDLAPLRDCIDAGIAEMERDLAEVGPVEWSADTRTIGDAHAQVRRMSEAYYRGPAQTIQPRHLERRLEVTVTDGVVLSGQSDVVAAVEDGIRDTKTAARAGAHGPQVGSYALLERSHGTTIAKATIDWIPRVSLKKPQPPVVSTELDVAACESAAWAIVHRIAFDFCNFVDGNEALRLVAGDPWAFPANPSSKMCSDRWCPAHSTQFCVEHAKEN
jgi:hypothetical protein